MNVFVMSRALIILCCSVSVVACTTPGSHLIPTSGERTLPALYQSETGGRVFSTDFTDGGLPTASRLAVGRELPRTSYVAQTAQGKRTVDSLYKPLPNPEIPITVAPHLVQSNVESYPKPWTTTAFFLYRSNHFAMPDERY